MRLTIVLSLIFLSFCSVWVSAQNKYAVRGIIGDSIEHAKLQHCSVAVLNAADSTLVTFTRSAENGTFLISGLKSGKFILLLSYPDYADYVDTFSLDSVKQEF